MHYAAGPGELDWKNQPDPFRGFTGSPQRELPLPVDATAPRYADLYYPESIAPQALTLPGLAAMLEISFGISAWKQYDGTRWALRCNPSSGNLHPTEAYVVIEGCGGIDDGVHHYVSRDHVLEQRCCPDSSDRDNTHFVAGFASGRSVFDSLAQSMSSLSVPRLENLIGLPAIRPVSCASACNASRASKLGRSSGRPPVLPRADGRLPVLAGRVPGRRAVAGRYPAGNG